MILKIFNNTKNSSLTKKELSLWVHTRFKRISWYRFK